MQKFYLLLFKPIFRLTRRLNTTVRDVGIFLCCFILIYIYFFSHIKKASGEAQIIGSILVAIMLAFSIDREMKPISWNKACYYPLLFFGVGILMIGQIHSIGDGYLMYAFDISILFPALYFAWNNRGDYERLFSLISAVIIILGLISFTRCVFLAFRGDLAMSAERVQGFTTNPNYLGMMGAVILISGLFSLSTNKNNKLWKTLSAICVGIGISFAVISVSRTAMLSEIICILAFAIYRTKSLIISKSGGLKVACKRCMLTATLIGLVILLGLSLDDINYKMYEKMHAVSDKKAEELITKNPQQEVKEAEKITQRIEAGGDTNTISSGRLAIWNIYSAEFSLWGKPLSVIKPQLKYAAETRAHNNIVDYLYRCGYIVGSFYIVYYIMQGIAGLRFLFSKRYTDPAHLFTVMMIGSYSVYAMLEISTLAFIRIVPCVYFLSIAPIFVNENNKSYIKKEPQIHG